MKTGRQAGLVPRSVGAAAEAALTARGDARQLKRVLDDRHVPIVIVDAGRRFTEANRAARLTLRLSLEHLRTLAIDDLASPEGIAEITEGWTRLLDAGCVAGRYQVAGCDGSRLDIVYCGLARALPGLHLIAFAPADWPEHELDPIEDDLHDAVARLPPRALEVLVLAADGHDAPAL